MEIPINKIGISTISDSTIVMSMMYDLASRAMDAQAQSDERFVSLLGEIDGMKENYSFARGQSAESYKQEIERLQQQIIVAKEDLYETQDEYRTVDALNKELHRDLEDAIDFIYYIIKQLEPHKMRESLDWLEEYSFNLYNLVYDYMDRVENNDDEDK